ncbi:MAG: RHS repeat-associated core domain-containing protein [Bryobacteraceae bacterium]
MRVEAYDAVTRSTTYTVVFTGHFPDQETCLDFAEARMLSSAQGRFTSPDRAFADQHAGDPQSWNLYGYVRNNPLANIDLDGTACFAVNQSSAFCSRAAEYAQIDASVKGQTRCFAAASAVSQALASSDIGYCGFISRLMPQISGTTQQSVQAIGQDLLQMNHGIVADIRAGTLTGSDLDARLVNKEQSRVQGNLDKLKKSDPAAYLLLIAESNAGLNPTDALRSLAVGTDKAYLGVLDGVRTKLGRNIDFSKQRDREAIGNALIQHIRETGGCDVLGDIGDGRTLQGCREH